MHALSSKSTRSGPPSSAAARWYNAVWRWHFYAGLFCIPFILWLSCTGAFYLWKPQIEAWIDRPYAHLATAGPVASASQAAATAVAAVPGSVLHAYELPPGPDAAARVIVGKGDRELRVYVHPQSLRVLKIIDEQDRLMAIVFRLHGELMMGTKGSWVVELAASWTIVLILTGLYLWWPRKTGLAGLLYPRLRSGRRLFWRDIHAVAGLWVSFLALMVLAAGLPWAASWGSYLREVRTLTGTTAVHQDWSAGSAADRQKRLALDTALRGAAVPAGHEGHGAMAATARMLGPPDYAPLDRLVKTVTPLGLAAPVLIAPPTASDGYWTATSNAQNRPLRTTLTLDPTTGHIVRRMDFAQGALIDRIIGYGVAAHEGQLFGLANQLLGMFTAIGLILLSMSSILLWWRRRPTGVLGAPAPLDRPPLRAVIIVLILVMAVLLPMFGLSLVVVLLAERLLRRNPAIGRWLGTRRSSPAI